MFTSGPTSASCANFRCWWVSPIKIILHRVIETKFDQTNMIFRKNGFWLLVWYSDFCRMATYNLPVPAWKKTKSIKKKMHCAMYTMLGLQCIVAVTASGLDIFSRDGSTTCLWYLSLVKTLKLQNFCVSMVFSFL